MVASGAATRHRYHGVFAPNHKLRPAVTALAIDAIHLRIEDPNIGLFDGSYDDCLIVVTTDDGRQGISIRTIVRSGSGFWRHRCRSTTSPATVRWPAAASG